jgi:hypothetical protein
MRAAVVTAAILASSSIASAQPPGLTTPSMPALDARPLMAKPLRAPKQRGTAIALSLAGTLAPVVVLGMAADAADPIGLVMVAGISAILLPSAGHWYAGNYLTIGTGIRLLGGVIGTIALSALVRADEVGNLEDAFWLGTLGVGIGAVYDIATAGSAVDSWNREHAESITPTAMMIGTSGYGVGVAGRF